MKEKMLKRFNKDENKLNMDLNPPLPGSLNIELTSACNHNCFFCYYHSNLLEKKIEPHMIEPKLLQELLMQAAKDGIGKDEVGFHMTGEPLLCKEFSEYVSLAKKLGFKYVFTTTNGVLANPDKMRDLVDAGLDSIRFSVNGATRESYKFAHGRDDFDQVVENIKFLNQYKKMKHSTIQSSISMVLTKQNFHEVERMKELFDDEVDELVFIPVLGLDRFLPEADKEYSLKRKDIPYEYTPCPSVFNSMYISCEGYVVPCCAAIKNSEMILADMNSGVSLKEIWYSENFVEMRKKFLQEILPNDFCRGCALINKQQEMIIE